MSLPKTDDERAAFQRTEAAAGPADNVVSTACPECGARFVLLAQYVGLDGGTWQLRCTVCPWMGRGELK